MAYTNIGKYIKPHTLDTNGNGSAIIINKGGSSNGFNGKNCVVTNLTATNADINNLNARNATINNANILYIMSSEGNISKLNGTELYYDNGRIDALTSEDIATKKLKVSQDANIQNLIADYIKSNNITTDYLTVNKSAHFFELIIDKIRSVQGTQLNTAANCVIDFVEAYDSNNQKVAVDANNVSYYRVYWRTTDNDGKKITNDWLPLDQAMCESFNLTTGVSYDVSNKYYWRKVIATDNGQTKYINFNTNDVSATAHPTFQIQFTGGFTYGVSGGSDNYTEWNVTPQVLGEWDSTNRIWEPSSTLYGIQLTPNNDNVLMRNGNLMFTTNIKTKLNIGIYYTDNSFDYIPSDTYKTSYSITTSTEKDIEAIVINTASIDKWDECYFIDLSNTVMATTISGKSAIPSVGDVVCQLGYRYTELSGYENTTTWRNNHKDEIARASAIIIAAYNTPDNEVKPPSYAQYQDIVDFSLGTHRKTYFDATGAYIKGALIAESDIDTSSIQVNIDSWRLLSDTSVVTKDSNNVVQPSVITLSLLNNTGSTSQIVTTLPSDKKVYVNGVDNYTYSPTNPLQIVTSYFGFHDINIELQSYTGTTPQVYDKLVIDTFDINATNGQNGSYIQFIYKNDSSQPSTPSGSSYPPTGWSTTASTPTTGNYTYMSQRTISFNSSNTQITGSWTTPIRITGDDGEAGTDGTSVEFIYHRTEDDTQPDLYEYRSDIPSPSGLSDDIVEYFSRPGDVPDSENRIKKWRYNTYSTWHNIFDYNYIPPSMEVSSNTLLSTLWTDEPYGVDEDYPYEWVSTRLYNASTQTWGHFSDPVVWAKYGQDGAPGRNGTNGTNGTNGVNGEVWKLVPLRKAFDVKINTGTNKNYDTVTGALYTDLAFAIAHVNGSTSTYLTKYESTDPNYHTIDDINSYSLKLLTDNTTGNKIQSNVVGHDNVILPDGTTVCTLKYHNDNYLEYTSGYSSGNYTDYYYLHKNALTSRMPTRMTVKLMYGNVERDTFTIDLEFAPDHVFSATDYALNSVYQGLSGDSTGQYNTTGFSHIRQNWESIDLSVSNIQSVSNGNWPSNTDYQQWRFYKKYTSAAPSTPYGDITENRNLPEMWTSYHVEPDTSYNYVYSSMRSRTPYIHGDHTSDYSQWGAWSSPSLYQKYGSGRGYVNSAQLSITADSINSTVSSVATNVNNITTRLNNENCSVSLIDLTGSSYNEDYFYPCWFDLSVISSTDVTNSKKFTFQIDRPLDSSSGGYGTPSWGNTNPYGSHEARGVSLMIQWEQYQSRWGENPNDYIYFNNYELVWTALHNGKDTETKVFGHYSEADYNYKYQYAPTSKIIFYLRGGSKYNARINYNKTQINANWSSSSKTFTENSNSYTYPVITNMNDLEMPTLDQRNWSTIEQTANNIALTVNAQTQNKLRTTGINIEDGTIELTAENTKINGNLNVYNQGEGITLYDSNGTPRAAMQSKSIGTPSTFDFSTKNYISTYVTGTVSSGSLNVTTSSYNAGQIKAGASISASVDIYIGNNSDYVWNKPTSISVTISFYRNGSSTVEFTKSLSFSRSFSSGYYYPTKTFTQSNLTGGNYTVKLTFASSSTEVPNGTSLYCTGSLEYNVNVDSITLIGLDGFVRGVNEANYNFISNDETIFEKVDIISGNYNYADGIRLSSNGLQRLINYNPNLSRGSRETWVEISGYKKPTFINQDNVTYGNYRYGNDTATNVWKYTITPNDSYVIVDEIISGGQYNERAIFIDLSGLYGNGYIGKEITFINIRNHGDVFLACQDGLGLIAAGGSIKYRYQLSSYRIYTAYTILPLIDSQSNIPYNIIVKD